MREPADIRVHNLGLISHNYEAELTGLQLALKYLEQENICNSKVLVVCDCVPAMEATFTNKNATDYNNIIMNNRNLLYHLKTTKQNTIEVVWAPSHTGIQINEMADMTAKEEADRRLHVKRPLERKIVLTHAKEQVLINWQRRVDHELSNHQVMEINEIVKSWKIHNFNSSKHLIRLVTGHHFLNSFQSKVNNSISKNCSCGQVETMHHYLFLCQKYMRYRLKWHYEVVGITEDIEAYNRISLTTAFGQRSDLSDEKNRLLQESLCKYIQETKRFI